MVAAYNKIHEEAKMTQEQKGTNRNRQQKTIVIEIEIFDGERNTNKQIRIFLFGANILR